MGGRLFPVAEAVRQVDIDPHSAALTLFDDHACPMGPVTCRLQPLVIEGLSFHTLWSSDAAHGVHFADWCLCMDCFEGIDAPIMRNVGSDESRIEAQQDRLRVDYGAFQAQHNAEARAGY